MSEDIVTRLRAVLHNDRSVELMNHEAAEDIMQLRQQVEEMRATNFALNDEAKTMRTERDEARRDCCRWMAEAEGGTPEEHAQEQGWDCFKEEHGTAS